MDRPFIEHHGLRRSSRSGIIKTVDELTDEEGAMAPDQEQCLAARTVSEALGRLSDQHREVNALIGLEEMSYRDTSDILGVPVGTVMSRLSRALEQMRLLLDDRRTVTLRRVK